MGNRCQTSWSQSTSCCSLRLSSCPVARKFAPSRAPEALKDQHDPQEPCTRFENITKKNRIKATNHQEEKGEGKKKKKEIANLRDQGKGARAVPDP